MATITRSVDRINNATVIYSVAPAPCSPILTVFVMKAATNGSSARRIAHSQLCAASSGSRPAQCTPAMMTAYIPEVDSCYVADLTHSLTATFLPFTSPYKEGKFVERQGSEEGVHGSTSLRKQESFPIGNGVLIWRNVSAVMPLSVAHYCTMIALKTYTLAMRPICSARLCSSCDSPLP